MDPNEIVEYLYTNIFLERLEDIGFRCSITTMNTNQEYPLVKIQIVLNHNVVPRITSGYNLITKNNIGIIFDKMYNLAFILYNKG